MCVRACALVRLVGSSICMLPPLTNELETAFKIPCLTKKRTEACTNSFGLVKRDRRQHLRCKNADIVAGASQLH